MSRFTGFIDKISNGVFFEDTEMLGISIVELIELVSGERVSYAEATRIANAMIAKMRLKDNEKEADAREAYLRVRKDVRKMLEAMERKLAVKRPSLALA